MQEVMFDEGRAQLQSVRARAGSPDGEGEEREKLSVHWYWQGHKWMHNERNNTFLGIGDITSTLVHIWGHAGRNV